MLQEQNPSCVSALHVSARSERENRSPEVKNTAGQPTEPLLEPFKVIKNTFYTKYVLFVNWKFFLFHLFSPFILFYNPFTLYYRFEDIILILFLTGNSPVPVSNRPIKLNNKKV